MLIELNVSLEEYKHEYSMVSVPREVNCLLKEKIHYSIWVAIIVTWKKDVEFNNQLEIAIEK